MNILMVSANYPPKIGGPSATVPLLSKCLKDKGFDVQVLTEGFKNGNHVESAEEFVVHRIGYFEPNSNYIFRPLRTISSFGRFGIKFSHRLNFDIVHSHDPNISAISGLIIKYYKGIPGVVKYSGDFVWEFLSLRNEVGNRTFEEIIENDSFKVGFLRFIERRVLDSYEKIIVQTEYQKKILDRFLGINKRKIAVIPNSVSIHNFDKILFHEIRQLFDNKIVLSSACRIVAWKGLEYLIRALSYLPKKYVLVLFGDGPDVMKLKNLAADLKVNERVIFFGKVPHEKIQTAIKATDIFVLPSLYEPAGVALLDAFAAQVPVVAARTGGIPEIVSDGETGFLVNPGDAKDIAEKIMMISGNPDFVEEMKLKQSETLAKYDMSHLINRYIDLYDEIKNQ
ncbi:MAG: glycosyltransferase family 4 protein [Ignavibacteriaceae bacterium]